MCYNITTMKKKRIASLLLLAPLALLGACTSTPSLGLEANWFSNVSTKIIPDGFNETLEYKVSFEQSSADKNGRFSMNYPNGGTYTVNMKGGSTEDGKKIYVYETALKMEVQYTLNGVSTPLMEDVVTTHVEFLGVANELQPISSWREVHATTPLTTASSPAATLNGCYKKWDYKNELTYDFEKKTATFTQTDLSVKDEKETPENQTNRQTTEKIKIGGKGLFFDNEQMIPLLRAAELSSSMVIRTIDVTTNTLEKMAVRNGPTSVTLKQSVKLKTDEEAKEREFNAYEISLGYKKQNSGPTQKFTIASCVSRDSNTFRNVCLKFEQPTIYSHGTLTYTLIAADFYE